MRVDLGLLLLLLALCGSGAQGEDGGLGEESTKHTTKQTTPDIWDELRALRDKVVKLEVFVKMLQTENTDLQARLIINENELVVSKSRIDQLESEDAELQIRLSRSESELVVSKSRIDQLERENAEKPKVAFYAGLTNARYIGPYNGDMILRYSKVFTNIGNAYNSSTGFFTAPVEGVYYLQFTLSSELEGDMGAYVYKNNQRIMFNVKFHKELGFVYITNSVILELAAGDEIHLVLPSGLSLIDDANNHSTFSGALLFPL